MRRHCAHCGRTEPTYVHDPHCTAAGRVYCEWVEVVAEAAVKRRCAHCGVSTVVPRAAVALVEWGDGRILCVWHRRYHGWAMPGGKVEEDETPEQACARKLEEETGMLLKSAKPIFDGPYLGANGESGRHVHVFRVEAIGEPAEVEEGCPVTWLTREELVAGSPFAKFYVRVFAAEEARR